MADTPYVVPGQGPAPFAWDIQDALSIRPKIARASYDGTGAAGAFQPCLRIVSDSGHILYEAVSDVEVAAGASADVSWFRGVKPAQAAAGVGAAWFFGQRSTNFSIPSGGSGRIPWTFRHEISDSSVFQMHTQTNPNDTVNVLKPGILIASTNVVWDAGDAAARACQIASGTFWIDMAQSELTDAGTLNTSASRPRITADMGVGVTESVPQDFEVVVFNGDGVARNVTQALFTICYLPNSVLVT